MRLNVARWSVVVVVLGACSHVNRDGGDAVDAASGALASSERAHAIVRGVDARFRTKLDDGTVPLIARSTAILTKTERSITADVNPAVSLPLRANGATELSSNGVSVAFTLLGANDVPAETADGLAIYPAGGPSGADVLQRIDAAGAEDYLVFEKAPAVEEVRYRVDVSRAAGLRVIDGVVELLDSTGAPRLRMSRPWLLDTGGAVVTANVAVEECAVDTDRRAPWGRAITPPGAGSCVVRITWSNARYPAVLDPSWAATTGMMTVTRAFHTAVILPSNKVLLAGGSYGSTYDSTAELYDPVSKTFAATGAMTGRRANHAAALLSDGKVLVAGGRDSTGPLQTAETYDPATGAWGPTSGLMTAPRELHQAATLGTGAVLVAGGANGGGILSTAELYSPSTRTFTATGSMLWRRRDFTLAAIPGGKVLAATGYADLWPNVDLSQCEVFEPLTGTWTATTAAPSARHAAGTAVLKDGRVLIAGGYSVGSSAYISTAAIFNGTTGAWVTTGSLSRQRKFPRLTTLSNGAVLAAGGINETATPAEKYLSVAEVYTGSSFLTSTVPAMAAPRHGHTATALPDGTALIAGGQNNVGTLASAEIFALSDNGQTCSDNLMCKSGFCVDGVCCNTACTTACYACTTTLTGGTNGTCAPVSAGTDPKNSCKDDGSPTCMNNGLCDGAGACQKYPVSTGCTAQPCTTGSQCTSGYCYDGVCCNSICSSRCKACSAGKKGYSVDGLCENIKDGTDPDSECGTMGTGTCSSDGVCDGMGACRVTTAGTTCAAAACVGTTSVASESACTNTGACTPKTTTPCQPYACDPATSACKTTCASDADCATGLRCTGGACTGKPNGSPCAAATECTSGFCADGVCCNEACTGQCEACGDTLGICVAVKGKPRGTRTQCSGSTSDPICGRQCDGTNRTACQYPPSTTACGAGSTCSGSNLVSARRCNGSGSCSLSGTTKSCAPFTCDPATIACKTSCTTSADCSSGFFCQGSLCLPGSPTCDGSTIVAPDGVRTECAPFGCNNGRCTTSCTTKAQCAADAVCDTKTRKCLQGTPVDEDSGCGCATPGRTPSNAASLSLLALAAIAATRIRRGTAPRR